jgi:hypothetical protein
MYQQSQPIIASLMSSFKSSLDDKDEAKLGPLSPTSTAHSTFSNKTNKSAYHIYHKREIHRTISPVIDPSKERFWGPTIKQIKENRAKRKLEKTLSPAKVDDEAFFLNQPYLAFHMPPAVLYSGTNRYNGTPLVLIHASAFWRKWKLQLGPSLSTPGVIDPRGVVCWKHNGGSPRDLKADDHALKGYKVRTWRLWAEHGKEYVHSIKAMRKAGGGPDPDILDDTTHEKNNPIRADEVVWLTWTRPLSRHTRRYHFRFKSIDFYWKGTGSVRETRSCGWGVRYNHLKLVAMVPTTLKTDEVNGEELTEICLGKYTSSVAAKKCGTLELFDAPIWQLMCQHAPSLMAQVEGDMADIEVDKTDDGTQEYENRRIAAMRRTYLYQVIVATGMCMIQGEKEKREVIKAIVVELISGGTGATG